MLKRDLIKVLALLPLANFMESGEWNKLMEEILTFEDRIGLSLPTLK